MKIDEWGGGQGTRWVDKKLANYIFSISCIFKNMATNNNSYLYFKDYSYRPKGSMVGVR